MDALPGLVCLIGSFEFRLLTISERNEMPSGSMEFPLLSQPKTPDPQCASGYGTDQKLVAVISTIFRLGFVTAARNRAGRLSTAISAWKLRSSSEGDL
jgi:hypothetical protein